MRACSGTMRAELIGAGGVVERNAYLTKRYIWWDVAWFVWTVANTLTIVFIAKGIEATGGTIDVEATMTTLLIGAVVWAYLGILFEFLMETVAWERWEGTIEYTFMAPLSRAMHLAGQGVFAVALRADPGAVPVRRRARSSSSTCPCPTRTTSRRSSCSSCRRSPSSASG